MTSHWATTLGHSGPHIVHACSCVFVWPVQLQGRGLQLECALRSTVRMCRQGGGRGVQQGGASAGLRPGATLLPPKRSLLTRTGTLDGSSRDEPGRLCVRQGNRAAGQVQPAASTAQCSTPLLAFKVDGMSERLTLILKNHSQQPLQRRAVEQHSCGHPLWVPLPRHRVDLAHCRATHGR